jgi:hypothetical protein
MSNSNDVSGPDAGKPGWIKGWGVVRSAPWHFVGIYPTESEARAVLSEQEEGFDVRFGSNQTGTDNFLSFD